ncbi:sigma factor [Staphylococcus simulans]|uniref:sigma factor n=1 Tax=Staphylococcus simulans TaxID=1286 RepID=UPI000D03BB9B|nr:sigma factor [Staphylococcus simulans]PTJ02120.1 RNA polymerase subunit sigma [Staphylococcus simulans]PTJ16422.1 RNA polymerase subunit sigma [Staphylococcus simulans]PTJ45884.1 RNA polymerase subunit sigma [Staphylococcus simulans]PTJ86592.1 RNA polymerase subunit sigma [Staphylococcus simulans]
MNIETLIIRHQGIIYALLKRYNIKYDIDEYAQLLSIKMWSLLRQFDTSIHNSMSGYLFQRLNYYLIDLFRKKSKVLEESNHAIISDIKDASDYSDYNYLTQLIASEYYLLLNDYERMWLNLKLCGYKQFEIQTLMKKSATTIRKYQMQVRHKLAPLKHFLKGEMS